MPGRPRIYFFCGTDSRASLAAVRRWQQVFEKKYGTGTRYAVEADELSPQELAAACQGYIQGQALFAEPKLIVVKRLTAQEKGPGTAWTKAFIQVISPWLSTLDETITLVVWEDKALGAKHPLRTQFEEWKTKGLAEINLFSVPKEREVLGAAQKYLASFNLSLESQAAQWLVQQYGLLEKKARLERRLKSQEELLEDDRAWWLYQLLDGASLRTTGDLVDAAALRDGHQALGPAVGAFEVVNAVLAQRWQEARRLLGELEKEGESDSAYYGLYAALRWQLKKSPGRLSAESSAHCLRLLAEVEIVGKNFPVKQAWLADRLVSCLETAQRGGERQSLIAPRQLWLAGLPKS